MSSRHFSALSFAALASAAITFACSSKDTPKGETDASVSLQGPVCSGKKGLSAGTAEIDGSAGPLEYEVEQVPGSDGGTRMAFVRVPPSYDPTKPTELVVNFHGLIEPATLQAQVSLMSNAADARNFIVAYPQGLNGALGASWNAGNCCGGAPSDMAFVRALVADLEDKFCIDEKRVFATGLSNGAMLSYRLACEASDIFAAVAPVAGAVEVATCTPPRPVPVLAFHGTADTIVPYNGGLDGIAHALTFPPVTYSIDLFRQIDGCTGSVDGVPLDAAASGSTVVYSKGDATCRLWSSCSKGSEVELCTIDGGGHNWPGGRPLIGKTSHDIDATNYILDFFDRHPMP